MKLGKIDNRHKLDFSNVVDNCGPMENYDRAIRMDIAGKLKMKSIKAGLHLVVATAKLDGENFRVGIDERGVYLGQRNNSFYVEEKNDRGNFSRHPHQDKFNDEAKSVIYDSVLPWLKGAFDKNWIGDLPMDEVTEYTSFREYVPTFAVFSAGTQNVGKFFKHSVKDRNDSEEDGYLITDMTFFGELVGNKMQKRFIWHHQGLDVYFFDFAVTYAYRKNGVVDTENAKTVTFGWMFMKRVFVWPYFKLVPAIKFDEHEHNGRFMVYELPCLWDTLFDENVFYEVKFDNTNEAAQYVGYLNDVDRINPNELRPMVEKAVNYGPTEGREDAPGEGYVVSSALPSVHPFRYKNKSVRFTEAHSKPRAGGRKAGANQAAYVSPFVRFVTLARVEHALERVSEQEGVTVDDLTTRHIPDMIDTLVKDVEVEENGGEVLDKKDRKRVGNEAVRIFKEDILAKRV